MHRMVRRSCPLGLVLLCAWTALASAQTDAERITVRVEGATIHAGPNAESQVIERPAVGSVYEVVRKAGEWYEVKLPSRLGMTITGFLHEKFLMPEVAPAQPQTIPEAATARTFPAKPSEKKRGYISIAGVYKRQGGYDYSISFPAYLETGTYDDSADDGNALGFKLTAGFLLRDEVDINIGFQVAFGTLSGTFAADWPNKLLFNDIAHAEASADHGFKEILINLGVNVHLVDEGPARPYLGGGASFIHCSMELLEDFTINEVTYLDNTHDIIVSDPQLSSEAINTIGFFGKAGLDIFLSESFALFGEGQYMLAMKKEAPQPMGEAIAGENEVVEIDLSGISVLFGAKISF